MTKLNATFQIAAVATLGYAAFVFDPRTFITTSNTSCNKAKGCQNKDTEKNIPFSNIASEIIGAGNDLLSLSLFTIGTMFTIIGVIELVHEPDLW